MRSILLLSAACLFPLFCFGAEPDAENVVFNEIFYNPGQGPVDDPDNEGLEYVELYNRGDTAVDLSSWYFSSGIQYTFPEGTVIPADGYLVIAKDPTRIQTENGIEGVLGPFSLRLDDGGEELTLKLPPATGEDEGLTIENVRYDDEPPWPVMADGEGFSLERINPFWSNDRPGNWEAAGAAGWFQVSFTGSASSSRIYIYMNGAGEALVDDVQIRPAGGGADAVPNGGFEDGLSPWERTGNHSASYVESGAGYGETAALHLVASGAGGSSSNSVNCYTDPDLVLDDPYVITARVKFLSGTPGLTMRLSQSGIVGTAVPPRTTPGAKNTAWSLDAPPGIENPKVVGYPGDPSNPDDPGIDGDPDHRMFIFHDPPMPDSSDRVWFQVFVRDDHDDIAEVLLHYDDGAGGQSRALSDDGAQNDGYAGDGVYGGSLAPRSIWTIVKYWFTATDGSGNTRRFPRLGQFTSSSGYLVHPAGESSEVPVHYIFLDEQHLEDLNADIQSDTMYPASVVYNGEFWHNASVRYRGHTARIFEKHHWKVKFVKDHRFSGYPESLLDVADRVSSNRGGLGDRLRTINLNSSWGDKSYIREYLAFEQFRLAGLTVVPGAEGEEDAVYPGVGNYVTWVTMYLNGEYYGLYTYVEQSNEDFLQRNGFDDHGALYKGYGGAQGGTGGFVQKTGPTPEALTELASYVNSMNSLSGQQMADYINEHMDVDNFIAYLVANSVVHNADQCGKNYYVYQDYYGADGLWYMFPWDMDLTMGRNFECCPPCGGIWNDHIRWDNWNHPLIMCTQQYPKCDGPWNGIINGFLARTDFFVEHFYDEIDEQLDQWYREEDLFAEIELLREKLRAEAARDLARWPASTYPSYGSRDFDHHVDELKRFVQNRIETIRQALSEAAAPPIENLTCSYREATEDALLQWIIPKGSYEEIRLYRDGALLEVLSGDMVETTAPVPQGADHVIFRVASVWDGTERDGASCLVVTGGGDWIQMINENFSPAPHDSWQLNGSASFVDNQLQTTPAQNNMGGTAFFNTKVPSESFRAFFDLSIGGSPAGADGMTFLWIRNSSPVDAIGLLGHHMAFWGGNISGYAVEFDTWFNDGMDPNDNHVALDDSRTGGMQSLAAEPVGVNFEGTGTFHVEVLCEEGFVTVALENPSQGMARQVVISTQIDSYIAGQAYFGFSGATGGANADHRIDNFVLEIPGSGGDAPVPDFTASPRTGEAPLTVGFTNQTSGDVDGFRWYFGDGQQSIMESPVHTYTSAGSYTVRLEAAGPGGTATEQKTDYIVVDEPQGPEADFYAMPTGGEAPLNVQFLAAVTNEELVTSYLWDFGDGGTSDKKNPAHIYRTPGAFTVQLTVTGPLGDDTEEKPEYIEVDPPPVPDVRFSASPLSGEAPLLVFFTNETAGLVDSYLWSFGDGDVSDEEHPEHQYEAPGLYSVTLSATYGDDQTVQFFREDYIEVLAAQVDFIRGDVNNDGGADISDAINILSYLFAQKPLDCVDAADTNDDGQANIADVVYILAYLFAGGPEPPPPFPDPGQDPTADSLECNGPS